MHFQTRCLMLIVSCCVVLSVMATPRIAPAANTQYLIQTMAEPGKDESYYTQAIVIHVLVTSKGKPVTNLGDDVGDGTASINLPPGWKVINLYSQYYGPHPQLGFATRFINRGKGVYQIWYRFANCMTPGDYQYVVSYTWGLGADYLSLGSALGTVTTETNIGDCIN